MSYSDTGERSKQRRFMFGVGTVTALVIVGVLAALDAVGVLKPSAPPEDPPAPSAAEVGQGPTPDVSFILAHRGRLDLDAAQTARLQALSRQEQAELAPLLREIEGITKDFEGWLAERTRKGAPHQGINAANGDLGGTSRRVASIRQQYWAKAERVLSAPQRQMAAQIRRSEMQEALGRLRDAGEAQ